LNTKVEAQASTNAELRSTVAQQQSEIETLAAQLKKTKRADREGERRNGNQPASFASGKTVLHGFGSTPLW